MATGNRILAGPLYTDGLPDDLGVELSAELFRFCGERVTRVAGSVLCAIGKKGPCVRDWGGVQLVVIRILQVGENLHELKPGLSEWDMFHELHISVMEIEG